MPYVLLLVKALSQVGWKVKVYDFERLEPPHVTIYRRGRTWRVGLRDGEFLDRGDRWNQIDDGVRAAIEANWQTLVLEWDAMHPDNPVHGDGHE